MSRVLVGNTYFMRFDPKQWAKMKPYPPLATLHLAGWLRSAGHEVAFFDAMLADGEADFAAMLHAERPDAVVLFEDNFNFLSKMCLSRMREAALTMAAAATEHGSFVIVAGSDASDHPEAYLTGGADVVAVGEGDHTVMELLELLDRHGSALDPRSVNGVAVQGADGEVERTAPRPNERRPDTFGLPAWDLIDVERYRSSWTGAHGYFSINMASTRGCPFHCNWCAKPIWGQRYAMRSPESVASELDEVRETLRPDHVWFADDIFGLRPSWLTGFADEVERRGIELPFTIQSRCDLMTPEAVEGLRRAGCAEVWLGAESGSQRILDAMDKGTTLDEVRTARDRLRAAGIRACFFIQFGYPGEQWDDIMATVEMVRSCLPDDIGVSVSYPLPGTRFHAMVADQLGNKTHWEDSGDLAMMFRGTYTTELYRALHTALHDDLELRRREAELPPSGSRIVVPERLDEHRSRVDERWRQLVAMSSSARNTRPTILVRAEPSPAAPDLSRSYN